MPLTPSVYRKPATIQPIQYYKNVIAGTRHSISFPLSAIASHNIYIAYAVEKVVAISLVPSTVGSDGSAVTLQVQRLQGTENEGSGDDLLDTVFDLKATVNTVISGVLTTAIAAGTTTLAIGDRLAVELAGTSTAAIGALTIVIQTMKQSDSLPV